MKWIKQIENFDFGSDKKSTPAEPPMALALVISHCERHILNWRRIPWRGTLQKLVIHVIHH
jgi:hypothetical protein